MARSTMKANVMIETIRLTYINVPPCSKNWASPCISCLLALARVARQTTSGLGLERRLGEGMAPYGAFLRKINLPAGDILSVWPRVSSYRGSINWLLSGCYLASIWLLSGFLWAPWLDVDDYVGNLWKLYLHFLLDLLGQPVGVDNAHVRRDLEVKVELHGAPHAA